MAPEPVFTLWAFYVPGVGASLRGTIKLTHSPAKSAYQIKGICSRIGSQTYRAHRAEGAEAAEGNTMKHKHTASTLLAWAGSLMTLSAVLTALCNNLAYGGILLAAASCMFSGAYHFRLSETKQGETEESNHE